MRPRQPLSYQIQSSSCWVTSVLNALLFLLDDKKYIDGFTYRLLHAVLADDGVSSGSGWDIAVASIGKRLNLEIHNYKEKQVEKRISDLHFSNQVAICDVDGGGHSILLFGKAADGYLAFDPDWNSVREPRFSEGQYATRNGLVENPSFPRTSKKLSEANLWIARDHLFAIKKGVPGEYRLRSKKNRTLTVISKSN